MPLTPDEILQRRLTDPYFGIAEEVAKPSLAQQKGVSLAAATVEKKRRLDPVQATADELKNSADEAGLGDIFEAGLLASRENIFDFISGHEAPEGVDRNEQIRAYAEAEAGLKPGDRQRLVGDSQDKVVDSLAKASLAFDDNRFLDTAGNLAKAAGQSVLAAPGTIAESGSAFVELGIGAAATSLGAGAGIPLLARRGKKVFEGGNKLFKAVEKAKGVIANAPRAAAQVSVLSLDQTQSQINDFTKLHGVAPTREQAAGMMVTTMASYMLDPTIISNLFVPKFKKQIGAEIRTLGKNLGNGSNLANIAGRIVDGGKKTLVAGGAEAAQEYLQTWVENLNVGMGPEQRKTFMDSLKGLLSDPKNQQEATLGAFLGFGAGAAIRGAVAAPAVAAGTAVDTAKGTAKVGVKLAAKAVKKTGQAVQAVANKNSFKVLSEQELEVIRSEHESRKTVVNKKVAELEFLAGKVKAANTIEELRGDERLAATVAKRQEASGLTDTQLQDKKVLNRFKHDLVRAYNGDVGLLKTDLAATNAAALVKASGKKVGTQTVAAAKKAVDAVSPGVEAVVDTVTKYGEKTVKAVQELRSSTALGMIELAGNAGKEEIKTIIEAAHSLDKADLDRVTAVIGQINPEVGKQLQRVQLKKDKTLDRFGLKRADITNAETIHPIIKDVAARGSISKGEVADVSIALNETVAGKITDTESLQQVIATVAAVESSADFKAQTNGAMTRSNMVVLKDKLEKTRARLNRDLAESAKGFTGKAASAVGTAAGAVAKAAKGIKDSETVKNSTDKVRTKVDDVTSGLKESAKKRAQEKSATVYTPELIKELKDLELASGDPKLTEILLDRLPAFIKLMEESGITSRADFELFTEQFPGINKNMAVYDALSTNYPSNIVVDEVFDVFANVLVDTKDKIKDAYIEMFPACKVP